MEDRLLSAVVRIATTLEDLQQQGLFQPDPAQAREAVLALKSIAAALDQIVVHLGVIEDHLARRS